MNALGGPHYFAVENFDRKLGKHEVGNFDIKMSWRE